MRQCTKLVTVGNKEYSIEIQYGYRSDSGRNAIDIRVKESGIVKYILFTGFNDHRLYVWRNTSTQFGYVIVSLKEAKIMLMQFLYIENV